jgi:hypothetical protein
MKRLVFVQANFRMIKDMAIGEYLKKLNFGIVDITKVPILPGRDERIENYYVF